VKLVSALGQYAHALTSALILRAAAWGLRVFVSLAKEEVLTAEQSLARELARWVGIPETSIEVRFLTCQDGSVLPKVELKSDISDKDRETILFALDRAFAVRQNCRTEPDGTYH